MKGLLKGLKYFQQLFEDEEKEPEMVIGLPTDVRHVAHIGHDSPSANTPSWMNKFKTAPELLSAPASNSKGRNLLAGATGGTQGHNANEKPKQRSRRKSSTGTGSPLGSPKAEKHHRRRSSNISMDSPGRDHPTSNLPRRKGSSNHGAASPMQDAAMPPKHSRQKKSSKASAGGGSTKPSRSKGQNSLSNVLEHESGTGRDDSQHSSFSDAHYDSKGNWSSRD